MTALPLLIGLLGSPSAEAASLEALYACLGQYDIPCAEKQLVLHGGALNPSPDVRAAQASIHFFSGRYPEAYDALEGAIASGLVDNSNELELFERTMFATAGWVEEERGRFVVRWRPGLDDLLIDDAFVALERAEEHLAPILGGPPPGKTILELYPDTRSFIAASSLTADNVYTTGTVALSKWSRLLVTSPRSRGMGYGWQDTIAHEYIHLVVAYRGHAGMTSVPVWLHEAIAKYLDNRWLDGKDRFALSARQKGALAQALANDDLVSFEEMHPSLAKLPTAERAALAYAQLASLMSFCFEKAGEDVLLDTLASTNRGVDARVALAGAVGMEDFDELSEAWLAWLRAQDLGGRALEELPSALDGGEEIDTDPVLAGDRRRADMVKLGDLLRSYDENEAALVEYGKALPADEAPSPLLANRIAQTHLAIDQTDEAISVLGATLVDYPEYGLSHKTLGQAFETTGRVANARASFDRASRYNPFDPEVREALARLARAAGDPDEALRQEQLLQAQRRGGADIERAPIHERYGTYELPRLDQHQSRAQRHDALRDEWVGKRAPSWLALDVAGGEIDPADADGDVVLIDFWATWCGPCRKAMPQLADLYERRKGEGLRIVGLSDESEARVEGFLRKDPVPYTIGVRAGDVKDRYRVSSLPTVFVVGRDGRIVDVVVGAGDAAHERIEQAVEKALAP